MSSFVLERLGFAVITLFSVLTIVFFIVRVLPGDPALVILGDQARVVAIDALRARLGLDRPLPVQYFDFLFGVLTRCAFLTSFPAVSASVCASPAPWAWSRGSSSPTNRSPPSTSRSRPR